MQDQYDLFQFREVDRIPDELNGQRSGKWEKLREVIVYQLGPKARQKGTVTGEFIFSDKKNLQRAQSTASACKAGSKRHHSGALKFDDPGFDIVTRSDNRVNNGYFKLYIQVSYKHK